MSDHHERKKCRICGIIYEQCRCPLPKVTILGICRKCKEEDGKKEKKVDEK